VQQQHGLESKHEIIEQVSWYNKSLFS
jgi:hypothetical protein